jgi:hypothetical protein
MSDVFNCFFLYSPINVLVLKADVTAAYEKCMLQHVEDSRRRRAFHLVTSILLCDSFVP